MPPDAARDAVRAAAVASVVVAYGVAFGRSAAPHLRSSKGTFFVFFNLGERAAIRFAVPPRQHPLAIAQNEARNRAAILAQRPIGGFLLELSQAPPFAADALSYLASSTHRARPSCPRRLSSLWAQPPTSSV